VEFAFGLDRLLILNNELNGFYIGKVVDDGANDPQGRIKARIDSLFGKESEKSNQVSDADLPWLQMMPSCGLYVRPRIGDFVTVMFQGSVNEGFYVGHAVSGKTGVDLGQSFLLNFHNAQIYGDYDGSITMATFRPGGEDTVTEIKMDAWTGELNIMSENEVHLQSNGTVNVVSDGGDVILTAMEDAVITAEQFTVNSGQITLNAGVIVTDPLTTVMPNPQSATGMGGPFCALPVCLLAPGVPHRGNVATNALGMVSPV